MKRGGTPGDWREIRLKDVCREITVGHVGPMADQYVEEGVPFLRSQNIQPFRLELDGLKFITTGFHAKLKKSAIGPGDVVVVRTGYPGTACVIPPGMKPANCADLVITRPSSELDPWFLVSVFNSTWGRSTVAGKLVGVAQQHFNIGAAKEMIVRLPPIGTQRKVSGILSTHDRAIENNTRRIRILEEMAQAIYREWFVHFRFPGHKKVKLVPSPLGSAPEGWQVRTLEDVCERITDGSHWSPKSAENGYLMASVKDMSEWGFNLEGCRKIEEADYRKLVANGCKPMTGDVLVAKDGASHLEHIFVVEKEGDLVVLSSIAILRPNKLMLPHLLAMYLKDLSVKTRMKGYASGAAIPRIVLKDFRKFTILAPAQTVQRAWWELVGPMIHQCYSLTSANRNLRRTRDLLLPKLISGELDVSDLDINVGDAAA